MSRNGDSQLSLTRPTFTVAVIVGCMLAVWLIAWGYMLGRIQTGQTAKRIGLTVAGKIQGLAHIADDTAHKTIQNVKNGLQTIHLSNEHRENDGSDGSRAASLNATDDFIVDLDVHRYPNQRGVVSILFKRAWAPLGVDRVRELVTSGFFDGVHFHRVLRGFIAQFGISGDPAVQHNWTNRTIKDDPVVESNRRGMVTFAMAGKHSRTTQLFINYANNLFLDKQGFSPVGKVVAGMDIVSGLYNEYQDEPNRQLQNMTAVGKMTTKKFLDTTFPELSYIISATLKPAPNR